MAESDGRDRGLLGIHARRYSPSDRDAKVIERFALQSSARELLPLERVSDCLRVIVPGQAHVKVMHSARVGRAHYKNLLVCGSVWQCPVCSAKISERRRVELTSAIERNGRLVPALLTLTIEHTRGHTLKASLSALLKAWKRMTQGKAWMGIRSRFGIVGSIRALEITHGANGWHPHLHVLVIFQGKPDEDELRECVSARWINSVKKQDRFANSHGCDIEFRKKMIGDYVTKFGSQSQWTIEHELVKAVSKIAKGEKGLSPFGLLSDYFKGNKHSGRLFKEYARTLKGQRQLCWSKGLRSRLGIGAEKKDEDLAKAIEEDAVLLAVLSRLQWKKVLGNDIRGELLAVAHAGDADKVWEFLARFGIERHEVGDITRPAPQLVGTFK